MAQRYQPPHLRQRGAQSSFSESIPGQQPGRATPAASSSSTPTRSNSSNAYAPQPSRRDWSTPPRPTHNALASPAGDLLPIRRTPIKNIDEMELIQSVSRSGGDGAEGDALRDWGLQDRYRRYINERLEKHYKTYPRERHVSPPIEAEDELHSLGSIVLLFRKLREGVVASNRIDLFAIEVFESSARLSILARNTGQLLSSLSGLIPGLYQIIDKGKSKAVDPVDKVTSQLNQLQLSDNRAEFASLLLLFHLVQSGRQAFHETYIELTSPIPVRLKQPLLDQVGSVTFTREAFISPDRLSFARQARIALSKERFDPMLYYRLMGDTAQGSPYERAILRWAEKDVKDRAWAVLSKAYLQCSLTWAGQWLGEKDEQPIQAMLEARGVRIDGNTVRLR